MNLFPWHPVDLGLKLALVPYAWFDSVLEWYTPRATSATAPTSTWHAGGTPAKDVATLPSRTTVNFENAKSRSGNRKHLRSRSRQSRFRWDQAFAPWMVVPDLPRARRLDRLFLSQYRAAAMGSAFAFIHEATGRFLPSPTSDDAGERVR